MKVFNRMHGIKSEKSVVLRLKSILNPRLPNKIPFVFRVILVADKVFTHNCDTGKLSILIQC
jgi:hypothetical protein